MKTPLLIITLFASIFTSQLKAQSVGLAYGWNKATIFELESKGGRTAEDLSAPREFVTIGVTDWQPAKLVSWLNLDVNLSIRNLRGGLYLRHFANGPIKRFEYSFERKNLILEILPIHFSGLNKKLKIGIGAFFAGTISKKVDAQFFESEPMSQTIEVPVSPEDQDILADFITGFVAKCNYDISITESILFSPGIYTDVSLKPSISAKSRGFFFWNKGIEFRLQKKIFANKKG